MERLLSQLQETALCAYHRSPFYRTFYRDVPHVQTFDDFRSLPVLTPSLLQSAGGATDFISIEDGQLVMEIDGLRPVYEGFPFTSVENEYDMERRYRRVATMLKAAGVASDRTLVITERACIYFAAQIERILPWPIAIALRDEADNFSAAEIMRCLGATTLIAAIEEPLRPIPSNCRLLVTFNGDSRPARLPPGCEHVDVLTLKLVSWLAVSRGSGVYETIDGIPGEIEGERQFHLERSAVGTLVVTVLCPADEPAAVPVVRYDTGIPVAEVGPSSFRVLSAVKPS